MRVVLILPAGRRLNDLLQYEVGSHRTRRLHHCLVLFVIAAAFIVSSKYEILMLAVIDNKAGTDDAIADAIHRRLKGWIPRRDTRR